MKKVTSKTLDRVIALALIICLVSGISFAGNVSDVPASAYQSYNASKDIDYTDGEGAKVVLTHKENAPEVASYELTDTRLTRNATVYMSMKVNFKKSWAWGIQLRDATCEIDGKEYTGKMIFRLFGNQGTLQVADQSIDEWPQFNSIDDQKWHTVTVKSTTKSFEVWIDGVKGKKLYYMSNVKNITSNYVCPAITLAGYNDGTVKDIRIWNDGTTENPVMPADRVCQSIEALPDVVSMTQADLSKIRSVLSDYQNLSETEKKFVVNYDKLELLKKALTKFDGAYELKVEGTKIGTFAQVFPEGIISHRRSYGLERYEFDTALSRKSTYYIQCVINLAEDSNCFDILLRDEAYKVDGKDVESNVSIRLFTHGALLIDQKGNAMSEWLEFDKKNLLGESHILVVESSPNACALWIDNKKYEFENINKEASGTVDIIAAKPGFNLTNEPEGTISHVAVWNDKAGDNTYSVGDAARIAIFNLPELNQLSLDDEPQVQKARKLYNALSKSDKQYVPNIEKLEKTERAIKFIKEDSNMAFMFLKDDLPQVGDSYVNLMSTAKPDIKPEFSQMVSYNAATYELNFTNSEEYINVPFNEIQGIGSDDTYLIKFVYKPYEYFYETETAAWMGLRVTFSGYNVGGNGAILNNKQQFAFMVNSCAIIPIANNQGQPTDYIDGFVAEVGKTYHVSMLCRQGKLKIWVNGKAVGYLDTLADYPLKLEFEGSRCKCDVTDIQLYNLSNPEAKESVEENQGGFKFIDDLLYGKEGKSSNADLNRDKTIMVAAITLAVVVVIALIVTVIFIVKKRKKKGEHKDEE